ncbi:hypothetical protein AcW1_007839 [Taiwanofungus camphoratus]|nr:hypothetical protein AcW2_007103 [Antrodia cinnamomea]KAI0923240.1 hypothetical protein AcV7_005811 [Antrodia cinnamomea]KAI0926729.1 hypothetical protein AcV5_007439 [Antrodia cinnamomea]KAI0953679.1 hypothetical protein AcW1_007839 [Antrodia cinnamomea]
MIDTDSSSAGLAFLYVCILTPHTDLPTAMSLVAVIMLCDFVKFHVPFMSVHLVFCRCFSLFHSVDDVANIARITACLAKPFTRTRTYHSVLIFNWPIILLLSYLLVCSVATELMRVRGLCNGYYRNPHLKLSLCWMASQRQTVSPYGQLQRWKLLVTVVLDSRSKLS